MIPPLINQIVRFVNRTNRPVIASPLSGDQSKDWLRSTWFFTDEFYTCVELRDANPGVIASWNAGSFAAPLQATTEWVMHQHRAYRQMHLETLEEPRR